MPMRVIAGSAKGRQLKLVPGDTTRPIMDRVKEALFNIIGQDILGSTFLDLFAGTGSVGIEALSRGAEKVVFIDVDRKALRTIEENLALTKLGKRAVVKRGDAFAFLKQSPGERFDYIFVAPPQYKGLWMQVLRALEASPTWIRPPTQVIVQIDPSEEEDMRLAQLEVTDRRRYGNTSLLFLSRRDDIEEKDHLQES